MKEQADMRKTMSKSAKVLFARQSTIQLFSLFSSVILARMLTPEAFGLYAIIGFFLQFLTLISDGGIGSSLIQRDRDPDGDTYAVAFTMIQVFFLGACVIAVPAAWLFAHLYRSMSLSIWMLYTFVLEFYLTSFRVVPAAKLERTLRYARLAVVETLEYFSFQAVAVILALMGNGVWSFIFGALVSRVVGLVLLYTLSPSRPSLRFDWNVARPMIRFGVALQLADIMNFVQNSLSPSFVAFRLGTGPVGFLNFARKVGNYPTYPLNVVNRMMFPLLSRIQGDEAQFQSTLNEIIRIYNIILFGTTAVLVAVVPETVHIVFGDKWMKSTELIYSVLLGMLLSGYWSPVTAAIQAKGRGKIFLVTNSLRIVINWGVAVPSVLLFGYKGLIAMNMTGLITFPIALAIVKKHVTIRVWSNLWRPTCALVVTYLLQRFLFVQYIRPVGILSLAACLLFGGVLYSVFILILDRKTRRWIQLNVPIIIRRSRWLSNSEHQEI